LEDHRLDVTPEVAGLGDARDGAPWSESGIEAPARFGYCESCADESGVRIRRDWSKAINGL